MGKLIKMQLRVMFHSKLFYVCLVLFLVMALLPSFIGSMILKSSNEIMVLPEIENHLISGIGLIEMIFITLFCVLDFTEGTTKNIVARGYSKIKLLMTKYLVSAIGVFCMYGVYIIISFLLYFRNGLGYDSTMKRIDNSNNKYLLCYQKQFEGYFVILCQYYSYILLLKYLPMLCYMQRLLIFWRKVVRLLLEIYSFQILWDYY